MPHTFFTFCINKIDNQHISFFQQQQKGHLKRTLSTIVFGCIPKFADIMLRKVLYTTPRDVQ